MGEANGEAKDVDVLFVYGTLMRSCGRPMARRLGAQSWHLGQGSVSGKLFSLGYYPGVTLSNTGRDRVFGEAVRLKTPARSLVWLDDYEGCGPRAPEPHDYERILLPIRLNSGGQIQAWIYIYKQSVARARLIPSGRFMPI